MRRSPPTDHRVDHLARLGGNLLGGPAAHGRPAPPTPRIRAALLELQHSRPRAHRRPNAHQ
ncbi:hypothetical protein [Streptomyces sp. NBC_01477]|uniref:hypothetical protein n=1 Tax=Streptomyces sp. NBC_01477 TaxID=2976015 RepID=UPI002E31B8D7|nr:hypothetical protein [Streptomyces sp. NBC_01477]